MSDHRDERIKELLAQLLDTPATQRAGVLELACAGDADLRCEVESLARAYEEGSGFFAPRPATEEFTGSPAVGDRIGRYHLIKQLGEGGFGTVFLAEQQHPVRRRVALKLIKLGMDTKRVIARFNAERQALAMMDHPHIARVYDAGATDTGRPYFIMELVEGLPITSYCDQHKLTIRERLQLFIQVCQAVQHAHTKGIIHRDLKPTNILVSQPDGVAVPKVIDFGIAKATQGRLTEQSFSTDQQHWLGTPQYMSPEQADGSADIDTRTDVYSLGVILYELLAGAPPFEFKSCGYSEIHRIIRYVEPPRPSVRIGRRELRGDLDHVVLKAMEKDRDSRYETTSAFTADLQRSLKNEPVAARAVSTVYRFRKFVRRHRLAVVVAVIVFLITTFAFTLYAEGYRIRRSTGGGWSIGLPAPTPQVASIQLTNAHDANADTPRVHVAQSSAPASPQVSVWEITSDSAFVRSGPDENAYPTQLLHKGDRITATGRSALNWLVIAPPQGSFAYVPRWAITLRGDGRVGVASREIMATAGSSLGDWDAQLLATVHEGQQVEILGEHNEFFKIKPPPGSWVYIQSQLARRVTTVPVPPTKLWDLWDSKSTVEKK